MEPNPRLQHQQPHGSPKQDHRSPHLQRSEVRNGNGVHHNNFLGRVRISGASLPFSEPEAMVQRYPLDKRDLFSRIKGDIALKVYALHGQFAHSDDARNATTHDETKTREPPFQEIDIKNLDEYKPPSGEAKKQQKTMKKDK
ncbi:hypothetical protein U1Q18_009533, partial [Sarracenia purpurea var. burkii]